MKKIHLENLPNLWSFSSGEFVKWPSLENVVVNHCPNLKKLGLGMINRSQLRSIFIKRYEEPIIDIDNEVVADLFELLVSSLSQMLFML